MKKSLLMMGLCLAVLTGCDPVPEVPVGVLKIRLAFDADQARLDNLGQPSEIPDGHAAQTPEFNAMSIHYIELVPDAWTQLGEGSVVYRGEETEEGGEAAIKFDAAIVEDDGGYLLELPMSEVAAGTYAYARASVSYQNYTVNFDLDLTELGYPGIEEFPDQRGTIASFVGFNTYIGNLTVDQESIAVDANKRQGFWAFEMELDEPLSTYYQEPPLTGEAPAGATTVVNPISSQSPVPAGSCVVTGAFDAPLTITEARDEEVELTFSFSINNSFEWEDPNGNGKWDFTVQGAEPVVDMGLRGLQVSAR
ncbi:hypothetical protein [Pontibacter sp. G13]|uniref:hypothetical protein n=1 Tax=Pontibacter sp. G13 TaxID=3074898 RepID=UPI00288C158D|nr:hypothetical protein [Pontibacter sp. G13]WNJ17768.1 hypothetical protein RJD25_23190 [Pontibacter sp. G13]